MITAEVRVSMEGLIADYWRRVDRLSSHPVDALYTDNGLMHIGALRKEGRAQIHAFFADRNAQETAAGRTTRHLSSGLWIELLDAGRLRVCSTVQVLSGHGEWPMASAAASSVGDFDDVVVQVSHGVWRFESRCARIVFAGAGAAAFAR